MTSVDFAEVERRAAEVRERLELGIAPVLDITAALADSGIAVVVRPFGDHGPDGVYLRRATFAAVLLNGDKYLPRFTFTGAHELGHHEYGTTSVLDLDIYEDKSRDEILANSFAASFLMPREALAERFPDPQPEASHVLEVANEFGVSYETLVFRLHNTHLIPNAATRDRLRSERAFVFTQDLRERRPSNPTQLPSDFVVRAVTAYRDSRISLDRLAEMLFQPEETLRESLKGQDLLHPEDG